MYEENQKSFDVFRSLLKFRVDRIDYVREGQTLPKFEMKILDFFLFPLPLDVFLLIKKFEKLSSYSFTKTTT